MEHTQMYKEYELKQEGDTYYIVHKQPQYPKTYEECCNVLNISSNGDILYGGLWVYGGVYLEKHLDRLRNFQKLLICRDAYWKIAGDWKLDFENPCYCLFNEFGSIQKYEGTIDCNVILAFPTKEMRDAFYENFKELIELVKELL